ARERVVAKRAQLRQRLKGVEKPVETQVLEGGRAVRSEETAAHGQGLLSLAGAAGDLRRSRPDRAVTECDRTAGGARRAMQLLDEGPGFDAPLPGEAHQRQDRVAALAYQRAAPHGGEKALPRRAHLGRATPLGRLRRDQEIGCIDVEALALRAVAGRLVRARTSRCQHVEQLLVDCIAGVVGSASPNQLDSAGMSGPAYRQAVHLPQLTIRPEQ